MKNVEDFNGVGSKTLKTLKKNGYDDVKSIAKTSVKELQEIGIGEKTSKKIISQARKALKLGFEKGTETKQKEQNRGKITTGSEAFDNMLYGGIPTDYITELYGENSSGKTQIALQAAVNVQLPKEKGGLGKEAIFIDTENTFTARRLEELAEAKGLDTEEMLDNIHISKTFDSTQQMQAANNARKLCIDNDIGLVVVDSIIGHFRVDYSGRNELAERQQELNQHMKTLKHLAYSFDLSVLITNQVMSDPGETFGDPTKPVGGNIISHNSAFIIYLNKYSKKRTAKLVDSPSLPDASCEFDIEKEGVVDL